MSDLLHKLLDQSFIAGIGYAGLAAIVFAESGLLIGFFLPGDSLLVVAGILAKQGTFSLAALLPLLAAAAIVGDSVGYSIGRRIGPKLFSKPDARLFKQEYVHRTEAFFERHGGKAIVLARFFPIIRTFAPTLAGVGRMSYKRFLAYNVIGGLLWACGVTIGGYALGSVIPPDKVDTYLLPILALVVAISLIPAGLEFVKHRRKGS